MLRLLACLLQDRRHRALGTCTPSTTALTPAFPVIRWCPLPYTVTPPPPIIISSRPTAVIRVMSTLLASVKQGLPVGLPFLEEAKCSGRSYTRVA